MTDWRTRGGTAACLIFAAVLFCVVVLSGCEPSQKGTTPNQPSPKESGSAATGTSSGPAAEVDDRVDGTLTVNGHEVSLKHAYAWTSKGALDDAKTDVHIHSALQHGYFSGTGHIFEPVSFDRTAVEGRVHSDGAQDAFGDKWEYTASFRAKVRSDK